MPSQAMVDLPGGPDLQRPHIGRLDIEFAGWRGGFKSTSPAWLDELRDAYLPYLAKLAGSTPQASARDIHLHSGRDGAPELRVLCGTDRVPVERLFVGPGWQRFHHCPGEPDGHVSDQVFGGPPTLAFNHDHLRVLRPELTTYYAGWLLFWLMLEDRASVALHAAVAAAHNTAIVLVGPSKCGKSTLVTALQREGADVYGDEGAFFTLPELHLYPAAGEVALRPGGALALGDSLDVSWHEARPGDPKRRAGACVPTRPCPKDRVLFVLMSGFGDAPELAPASGGEAARHLLRQMACGDPSLVAR